MISSSHHKLILFYVSISLIISHALAFNGVSSSLQPFLSRVSTQLVWPPFLIRRQGISLTNDNSVQVLPLSLCKFLRTEYRCLPRNPNAKPFYMASSNSIESSGSTYSFSKDSLVLIKGAKGEDPAIESSL